MPFPKIPFYAKIEQYKAIRQPSLPVLAVVGLFLYGATFSCLFHAYCGVKASEVYHLARKRSSSNFKTLLGYFEQYKRENDDVLPPMENANQLKLAFYVEEKEYTRYDWSIADVRMGSKPARWTGDFIDVVEGVGTPFARLWGWQWVRDGKSPRIPYAFNTSLSRKPMSQIAHPEDTVLVYEPIMSEGTKRYVGFVDGKSALVSEIEWRRLQAEGKAPKIPDLSPNSVPEYHGFEFWAFILVHVFTILAALLARFAFTRQIRWTASCTKFYLFSIVAFFAIGFMLTIKYAIIMFGG
jgi:hypothetical protein